MTKTSCPFCNSEQAFRPRSRAVDGKSWHEIYIACTVCNYEAVLERTNPMIEQAKKRSRRLTSKATNETDRHGMASVSTANSLRDARQQLAYLRVKLNEEIERDGSAAH